MNASEISLLIYNLALLPVVFFSVLFILITIASIWPGGPKLNNKARPKKYPFITVQIPSFNDDVAIRCMKACLKFTYPKNKHEIMVVDDSTNKEAMTRMKEFAEANGIKFIHRENRRGYKPGALRDAMPQVKGEVIVIFDADFIPKKDFLEVISTPFDDPKVAIVQGRQAIMNEDKNLITKYAAYLLQIYHYIFAPLNHKLNSVFFCGTGGAIRKSAIEAVGGWNEKSITEDSDLSVRILSKGYKNVYVPIETPSEVPVTLEGFIKQQTRWCFGSTRVFFDNWKEILFGKNIKFGQKFMMLFLTLGNFIAPAVLLMTVAGFVGWFIGELTVFNMNDFLNMIYKIVITAGFFGMGAVMLKMRGRISEFPKFMLSMVSISLILAVTNSIAVYKAVFKPNEPLYGKSSSWVCTAKVGNQGKSNDSAYRIESK